MKLYRTTRFDVGDSIFIPGDIHLGATDWKALTLAINAFATYTRRVGRKAKCLVLGDLIDSAYISRHGKEAQSSFKLDDAQIAAFAMLLKSHQIEPTLAVMGNHENWFKSYAKENPGLDHDHLYPNLYKHFEVVPAEAVVRLNANLYACHGHQLRGSCTKYPAQAVLNNYPGSSWVFGHNHRLSLAYRTVYHPDKGRQMHAAMSVGTFYDEAMELGHPALSSTAQEHSLGFGVVNLFRNDYFTLSLGTIHPTDEGYTVLLNDQLISESYIFPNPLAKQQTKQQTKQGVTHE